MSYSDLEQIAQLEKDKDEDDKLKQQAVTYTQFEELVDFEDEHPFKKETALFLVFELSNKVRDPEEWHRQFEAINDFRRINKFHLHLLIKNLA